MRELCRRDRAANRGQGDSNIFTISEIREEVLRAFDLEYVSRFIRGYTMENDPDIELVDDEQHVGLTNKGRNRCDDNQFGL
jgi:hypothetical protein